ncbi:MAG: tetratricopeptide repeat protein [Bacteroidota bacterium]
MNLNRIQLLLSQERYEMAEQEIRQDMGNHLHHPLARVFLGIALMGQDRKEEALAEAEAAIGLDPDFPFAHNLRGRIMFQLGNHKEAEKSLQEAIRLDPSDADHFVHLAYVHFNKTKWEEALQTVEQGLSLNPEHVGGLNLRARLLVKLGRSPEASQSFEASMNKDPENSYTHLSMGWALLEEGDHKQALEHFREAVRLDPDNESARGGLVEGLKARYWFYRQYLRFAFFMEGLNEKLRWALVIGLIVIANVLPALAPYYLGFVFFSWFSGILFNSLIRLNPYGRYALREDQILYSNVFSGLLLGGLTSLAVGSFAGIPFLGSLGYVLLLMLFPVTGTGNQIYPAARKKSLIYTWSMAGLGGIFLSMKAIMPEHEATGNVFLVFLLGAVAYTWWVQTLR